MLVLIKKLDEMARVGWRLISSHGTIDPVGCGTFMIGRERALVRDGSVG